MVWGAFSSIGKLDLAFPSCRMNSQEYIGVLADSLVPFKRRFRRIPFIFQQDNARIHVSNATMEWLQTQRVSVMEWPACSPDLNPIENLWGILVRRVYSENRQYETVEQLKIGITQAWTEISDEIINNLVGSMRNRIFELVNKNGKQINY